MTETAYTKPERDAIDRAYDALTYAVDHTRYDYQLRAAFKYERKESRSATTAKVLLVEPFVAGATGRYGIDDLLSFHDGCRFAVMLGATMALEDNKKNLGWTKLINGAGLAASIAHRAYMDRRVDRCNVF